MGRLRSFLKAAMEDNKDIEVQFVGPLSQVFTNALNIALAKDPEKVVTGMDVKEVEEVGKYIPRTNLLPSIETFAFDSVMRTKILETLAKTEILQPDKFVYVVDGETMGENTPNEVEAFAQQVNNPTDDILLLVTDPVEDSPAMESLRNVAGIYKFAIETTASSAIAFIADAARNK